MKIDFDFSHFCRSVVVGYENWIVFPDKLYISLRATRKFRRNMRKSEAMYSNEMFLLTHFVFCEMCRMSPHKLWVTTERRNSSQQCNGENVLRKRYNSRYSRDTWDVCIERWEEKSILRSHFKASYVLFHRQDWLKGMHDKKSHNSPKEI